MLTYENYGGSDELLEEVKYELDWMLTMQDASSGGVYHKITCANFPDTVSPEEETDQLILSPISTTATADFAATMAMAARVFSGDADYQATCLAAAKKAWSYLEKNPGDGVGFTNPDGIVTGEYADTDDADERYWALAELYKTTKDSTYLTALKDIDPSGLNCDLGWQNVGTYGLYAYLTSGAAADAYTTTVENRFYALVDEALSNADADAYSVAIGTDGYYWGSNMGVANKGMLFLMADQLKPDAGYVEAAEEQLNYLLGTNTNSYCFVTGFGTLSPEDPHHRPSEVKGEAISGMLVGGPNCNLEDSYAQATLTGLPNAACYVDNVQCYSCNEVAIYWNSPLVYLLNGIKK
jgi:endoglucanase